MKRSGYVCGPIGVEGPDPLTTLVDKVHSTVVNVQCRHYRR